MCILNLIKLLLHFYGQLYKKNQTEKYENFLKIISKEKKLCNESLRAQCIRFKSLLIIHTNYVLKKKKKNGAQSLKETRRFCRD